MIEELKGIFSSFGGGAGVGAAVTGFLAWLYKIKVHQDKTEFGFSELWRQTVDREISGYKEHIIKLELQISEYKKAIEDVRRGRESERQQVELLKVELVEIKTKIAVMFKQQERVIITTDENLIIKDVKGACFSITGYEGMSLVGLNAHKFIPFQRRNPHDTAVERRVKSREPFSGKKVLDAQIIRADGTELDVQTNISGRVLPDGTMEFEAIIQRKSLQDMTV